MTDRVQRIPSRDPRLGRNVWHDERSRMFALRATVDTSTWRTITVRVYDPLPNPDQSIGNCTGVSTCVLGNTIRNRVAGQTLNMADADRIYSLATRLDPFDGAWEPDDTGSSGLAAAKAAQKLGYMGAYRWLFGGIDEVVATIQTGRTVSVGTKWTEGMFNRDRRGRIEPTGPVAGGHQYTYRGYDADHDELIGRCWWGDFRDFRIDRTQAGELLGDSGDAHVQDRVTS